MGRTRNRKRDWHPKPVERIELSDKNVKLRIAAAVIFLLVGVGLLVYAFLTFVRPQTGWTEIDPAATGEPNCAEDFVFLYNLGASGQPANVEQRALSEAYAEVAAKAYRLFDAENAYDGVCNVAYLNAHPNEIAEIDETLYRAFALLEQYGDRSVYLATVYISYDNLFQSERGADVSDFTPFTNDALRKDLAELASFAGNPDAVEVELLGENRVRLRVSEDYLRYAEQTGVTSFVDFHWLTNAFITDYLAEELIGRGFTNGSISSYDGFTRNLGEGAYSFNLYNRVGSTIYPAAVMRYTEPTALVFLRNYPMNSRDELHYYEMPDGFIYTPYVDVRDGLCRTSTDSLTAYSRDVGCAEILLRVKPSYVADLFSPDAVNALAEDGVYAVYFDDTAIRYTDPALTLTDLYADDERVYTAEPVKS